MLSIFPSILFLEPFSAFIIRVALAVVLGRAALKHFSAASSSERENALRTFAVLESIAAAATLVGLATQLAAIVAAVLIIIWLSSPQFRPLPKSTALLSLVLCLSLLLTGAGPFAFDLPL